MNPFVLFPFLPVPLPCPCRIFTNRLHFRIPEFTIHRPRMLSQPGTHGPQYTSAFHIPQTRDVCANLDPQSTNQFPGPLPRSKDRSPRTEDDPPVPVAQIKLHASPVDSELRATRIRPIDTSPNATPPWRRAHVTPHNPGTQTPDSNLCVGARGPTLQTTHKDPRRPIRAQASHPTARGPKSDHPGPRVTPAKQHRRPRAHDARGRRGSAGRDASQSLIPHITNQG